MKRLISFLMTFSLASLLLLAQPGPDAGDLELLRSVMLEWFKAQNPDPSKWQVRAPEGDYFYNPGFGLILPTPTYTAGGPLRVSGFGQASSPAIIVSPDGAHSLSYGSFPSSGAISITGDVKVVEPTPVPDPKPTPNPTPTPSPAPSPNGEFQDAVVEVMKGFLESYGDLVNGMDSDASIMLVYDTEKSSNNSQNQWVWVDGQSLSKTSGLSLYGSGVAPLKISVRSSLAGIKEYRQGAWSQKQLFEAMDVSVTETQQVPSSYRILGSILSKKITALNRKFYQSLKGEPENETVESFFITDEVSVDFQMMEGYGVLYKTKYNTNFRLLPKSCNCPDDDERKAESEGIWDDAVTRQADQVYEEIPSLLVKYGRTLRELEDDEWLSLTVGLPGCNACDAPAEISMKVSQEILRAYDRGEISLDEAVGEVLVGSKGRASESRLPGLILFDGDNEFKFETEWDYEEGEDEDEEEDE